MKWVHIGISKGMTKLNVGWYLLSFKEPSHKKTYKVSYKEKRSNFTAEKLDRNHLSHMIKVNGTGSGTNGNHVSPDGIQWGLSATPVLFLPKMHDLNLFLREHQTNPKGGTLCKVTGPSPSKASRSWESMKDWGVAQTEGDSGDRTLRATGDPKLNPSLQRTLLGQMAGLEWGLSVRWLVTYWG